LDEFRDMVKALHQAGSEVILDAATTTPQTVTVAVPL
jgi:hypothetical protein